MHNSEWNDDKHDDNGGLLYEWTSWRNAGTLAARAVAAGPKRLHLFLINFNHSRAMIKFHQQNEKLKNNLMKKYTFILLKCTVKFTLILQINLDKK